MARCTEDLTQYAHDQSSYRLIPACTTCTLGLYFVHTSRQHCLQSCVACESVNYTIDGKVDFTIYMIDYTQELAGLFTLSATMQFTCRKVELSLIWAHVALCRPYMELWLDKNSICMQFRYTANTGCSFVAGMAHSWLCTITRDHGWVA